ncbi:MAG: C10 family peptidase, partial [Candidatus Aminicenantes bacterium]|nr:C10 family peptidase [Candidatus Aminicenantes bacterium]
MLSEYGYGTKEENNAVATLMYDVGVAIHSSYFETDTSAGYDFHYNFIEHFYYSPDLTHVHWANYQKLDAWFNVAKNQIDNGWPCEYGIGGTHIGHSVVIDGYRIDGNTKMLHLNFGWSGSHNGYFSMNNIFIKSTYDFTEIDGQTMTLNIYPYPEYKKPVGLPPEAITAEAFLNRSVFLSEYIIKISWSESPSEDKRIESYIIYQINDGSAVEVDRVDPENKTFQLRTKDISGASYSVGVIDKNGAISDMPAFVTPVLK